MDLPQFKLEEYISKYEILSPLMMGASDPEPFTLAELVSMADEECLSLWKNLKFTYTYTQGFPLLREEIEKIYSTEVKDNILVFTGAQEAIYIMMRVILKRDDHVVVLTPCYQSLKAIPKTIGANVIEFSLDWANNNWSFNLEKFASVLTNKTKLVILNFPHNPTGFNPSLRTFRSIIDIVKQHEAYLFSDEVYRLSEQDPSDCLPNAVDCYDKAISLGVMSKSFSLPGLRIGWLALHDKLLLHKLASYKKYTSVCNSAPSELLSLIALRNKKYILYRNREITKNNLELYNRFFDAYSFVYESYRPTAGFVSFPRIKLDINIEQYAKKLITEEGVMILPGTIFDNSTNHFRMGFGRSNFSEALIKFEHFTKKIIS